MVYTPQPIVDINAPWRGLWRHMAFQHALLYPLFPDKLSKTRISCSLKRFFGTKRINWGIWYRLKRFPRTTGQKTVTT